MEINITGYIACAPRQGVIYGTGKTAEEARINLREWAEIPAENRFGETIDAEKYIDENFEFYPATQALLNAVADSGGDIGYVVHGGVACTLKEYVEVYR